MLIRFNVSNFLSFSSVKDPETGAYVSNEFSMIPGKVRSKMDHIYENPKQDVLKFAAIYGANASGKSNIIKAISFMRKTVLKGNLPTHSSEKYTKTDPENRNRASYFSLEILLDSRCYQYGFEVNLQTGQFVSEWLYELGKESEKCLFEKEEGNTYKFESELKNITNLKIYADDIADNSILFLSLMNQNKTGFYQKNPNAKVLSNVFSWFKYNLDINFPERPISDFSYLINKEAVPDVAKLLSAFGTGVENIDVQEIDIDKLYSSIPPDIKKDILQGFDKIIKDENLSEKTKSIENEVIAGFLLRSRKNFFTVEINKNNNLTAKEFKFIHKDNSLSFDFSEESDGTIRLFDLIETLISNKNKTYIIDELDRCLHPCLTYKFVETFLSYAKERNVQLIVTSHESRLLDFDLLRRDEVWFVEKNPYGESSIYSLEEYNVRFDQKVDKAYLEGRYGGVPLFTALFPIEKEQ